MINESATWRLAGHPGVEDAYSCKHPHEEAQTTRDQDRSVPKALDRHLLPNACCLNRSCNGQDAIGTPDCAVIAQDHGCHDETEGDDDESEDHAQEG